MYIFDYQGALEINKARIKFIEGLYLPWQGKSVFETGCGGRGDFTQFLLSKQVGPITLNDSRLENIQSLQATLQRSFPYNTNDLNVDPIRESYDVVFSMGTLYHLGDPEFALRQFAAATKQFAIIETMTNGRPDDSLDIVGEDVNTKNQSSTGVGSRPSRAWVLRTMSKYFKHAYVSVKQPNHEEFPTDWTTQSQHNQRAFFLGVQSDQVQELISPDVWSTIPLAQQTSDR